MGSGVVVFTAPAVLDVDGDELLDSSRREVLVGTGVDITMNPMVSTMSTPARSC